MRVVVFGLGKFEIIVESYINLEKVDIIAFADNNKEFWGEEKNHKEWYGCADYPA